MNYYQRVIISLWLLMIIGCSAASIAQSDKTQAKFLREYENGFYQLTAKSPLVKDLYEWYIDHRNLEVLLSVSDSKQGLRYVTDVIARCCPESPVRVIIVSREIEPLLRDKLKTIANKKDQYAAAYSPKRKIIFIFESRLLLDDFDAVFQFIHEVKHAHQDIQEGYEFNATSQMIVGEIQTHRFMGEILNDLSGGWYFKKINQAASEFLITHPMFNQQVIKLDANELLGDIPKQMNRRVGYVLLFQYVFNLVDEIAAQALNEQEREIFITKFYFNCL